MDRLSTSQGGLFLPILTHRNDRGRWLQMTLTTAGIRHTIALIVRVKKCISFTLHINGKDHDLLAVDKIHVDLNWRYLNEYLDQISANDEVLFLKQGHEIIAKNQLAREKLIIYNSEGNYNIIDSVDTEYIEKTSAVPNNALFEIYFYYPGGNLLNASDKLFYLPFAFIIIVLLVVYLMTTRVFRRQFSEMTELVNTLAFLPDSTDQIEALKIREGDAKEIISIKNW